MAVFDLLGVGRSGLLAHQRALGVTGANVANANTPGYSRQREVLIPLPESAGWGVRAAGTLQVVDRYLEARLLAQGSALAGASVRRDLLDAVQAHLPVGDGSIGAALQELFAAVSELATHPEDLAVRRDVLDRAEALAGRIRAAAGGIAGLQREADGRIEESIADANRLVARVAELNRAIARGEATGGGANELRDQRRLALGELAERLEVRTVERADGTVDVFARSGAALVLGGAAAELATRPGAAGLDGGPLREVGVRAPDGGLVSLGGEPGGALGALLGVRDGELAADGAALDLLATTLRDAVNAVQTDPAGRDLDGLAGAPLFTGTGALDLTVALDDPRGLAAAQGPDPGDNTNALALLGLRTATFPALSGATLEDHFGALQARIGGAARDAADRAEVESGLAAALAAQRDAVSGVSLEEEFTDLVRFQRGFQAAARLVTASDRLLEDLLGMLR